MDRFDSCNKLAETTGRVKDRPAIQLDCGGMACWVESGRVRRLRRLNRAHGNSADGPWVMVGPVVGARWGIWPAVQYAEGESVKDYRVSEGFCFHHAFHSIRGTGLVKCGLYRYVWKCSTKKKTKLPPCPKCFPGEWPRCEPSHEGTHMGLGEESSPQS